jgi:hypothetical protein
LFPRYNFLKVFDPLKEASLSNFVSHKVKIPKNADYRGIWERVICPSFHLKYTNMRCSTNNEVRSAYKSEYFNTDWVVFYRVLTINLYSFLHCIGDTNRDNVEPDVLMQGVESYVNESRLDVLYDFLGRHDHKNLHG